MTDQLDALHALLTDVDQILRERLAKIGIDVAHVLVAVDPEGSFIVRANVLPLGLKEIGAELIDISEEALRHPGEGALH